MFLSIRNRSNTQPAPIVQGLTIVMLMVTFQLLSGCVPFYDLATRSLLPNEGVRVSSYNVKTKRLVGFTTSDGVRLISDIHFPKKNGKTPTILVRIPLTNKLGNRVRADVIGRYWARRGYTAIIQGTRGRYGSGGKFYPLLYERQDGIETLEWIKKQPWFDGNVFMWGASSFGHSQWCISDRPDLGLKALFVQIASTSFRRMFHDGGAFSLESGLFWAIRSRGSQDREVKMTNLDQAVQDFPLIEADDRAIGDTPFFNDWVLNQNDNKYWQKIDGVNRTHTLQVPILLMAGWFDPFLPTQIEDFNQVINNANDNVATETRLIIGPWGHANEVTLPSSQQSLPYRPASLAPSIPWFDYNLGIGKDKFDLPKVKIFVLGHNQWRNEKEWPLERTQYTPFYLHSNGKANSVSGGGWLDEKIPQSEEPSDSFLYDPLNPVPSAGGAMLGPRSGIHLQNSIELRDDVLIYSTHTLSEPVEVTGPVRLIIYVHTNVVCTDFTAKLVDVYPNGNAYNLCDGILRRNYQPSKNTEKVPTKIEIDLWPTSNIFMKGHKIRLEISSSNFPRYDRNPNTGEFIPEATKTVTAKQTIFHSNQFPSHLMLPIIPN